MNFIEKTIVNLFYILFLVSAITYGQSNNEVTKYRIIEGEYSEKDIRSGEWGEWYKLDEVPSLMVRHNGGRIIIYDKEKQVFDLVRFLPKEEYKADGLVFQSILVVDQKGREIVLKFTNIHGNAFLYITYDKLMLVYQYIELKD